MVSSRVAGRLAAALFVASGLITSTTPLVPAAADLNKSGVAALSVVCVLVGIVTWRLPWQRWPHHTTLWLVPVTLALIAGFNAMAGADTYRYSLFFVVSAMWIGATQPSGTCLRFSPVLAAAYLGPLLLGEHPVWARVSALYAVPVCVAAGETLGWVTSQLARAHLALRRNEERFRALVQNASDVVLVTDAGGAIVYVSPAVEHVMGRSVSETIATHGLDMLHPDDRQRAAQALAELVSRPGGSTSMELRSRHTDGTWRWLETRATNLLHQPGVAGVVLNYRDVTERRELEQRLVHQASHDALSGLPNRVLLLERIGDALARRVDAGRIAVLFVDLDNFKVVNDSLGHAAGDQLIVAVAERLQACVRPGDTVARLGGDEFTLLLDGIDGACDAIGVAEQVQQQLAAPFVLSGQEVFAMGSIGIVLSTLEHDSPDVLLREADVAMYRAKSNGKGGWALYAPDMGAAAHARLELETALRLAVKRGELRVHYQPIVDLETGRVNEVEALVRWQHPERGLVEPAAFIPLAEETGLIVPIGSWVLEMACRQMQTWHSSRPTQPPLTLSVNVSARQLRDPGLANTIADMLRQTGLAPTSLKLELTESVLMQDADAARLRSLTALGISLAIDDFGTGYSSLAYLSRMPIDTLKIDQSFVARLGQPEGDAVVRTIVALGHSLNMTVTAEGIERPDQAARLRRLGCDQGQGFSFAHPQPAELCDLDLDVGLIPLAMRPAA
jgi:diguanylate cyclase (GGDEF)-like protein/PAS domain S-box-containing protein